MTAHSLNSGILLVKDMGFRVHTVSSPQEVQVWAGKADALLLSVSPSRIEPWCKKITGIWSLPLLWWCEHWTIAGHECKINGIDGLLGPGMSALQIHCALMLSANHYVQRTEWQQERERLLAQLEERKWVDRAKRLLCEIKGIAEAEAYEVLRKQAMNERKRMSEVAASVTKVYQMLEGRGSRKS